MHKLISLMIVVGIPAMFLVIPATDQSAATAEEEQVAILVQEDSIFRDAKEVIAKRNEEIWLITKKTYRVAEGTSAAPGDNFADDCLTGRNPLLDLFLIGRAAPGKHLLFKSMSILLMDDGI